MSQPSVLVISDYRDSLNAVRPEGRWFVGLVRDHGFRVTLMTVRENGQYLDEMEAAGVRIIDFHPTSKFSNEDRDRIRGELLEGGHDILHLFNNKANVAGIRAARGWPGKVVTYRGYTGNVHWYDPGAYFQHLSPRVDRITCVSQAVKDSLDAVRGLDPAKTVVVPKGHDPAWYAAVRPADLGQETGHEPGQLVVMIVANARRMKGMDYLGRALQKLDPQLPLHFAFAGRRLETKQLVDDLEKSPFSYTFLGHRMDVLQLLAAADISLLPSVKGEGLSKVLLESMFLARPTIMTDIGGNKGLGVDGETALVIPARDEQALVNALEKLAHSPELRAKIGPAGQRYVSDKFGAHAGTKVLASTYRKLLS